MALRRILVVNPNSSSGMTDALKPQVDSLGHSETVYRYFTGPTESPKSINNDIDAGNSASACLEPILDIVLCSRAKPLGPYRCEGILIACYSVHPLVPTLRAILDIPVVGIFEASVAASLQYLNPMSDERFGIVSTGKVWEKLLGDGVHSSLPLSISGQKPAQFAGVETTGLNATELHDLPSSQVEVKMKDATKRLMSKPGGTVRAICLGCAGMVGMEKWVREACDEQLGTESGDRRKIYIIDGVKAGIGMLHMLIRGEF